MIQTQGFRFKHFLKERQQLSRHGAEELLSVSEYYGVAPRSAVFSEERQESRAESLEGYRIVKNGDLVMNYMLAWKGAYGISSYDGIVSPAYSVFEVNQSVVDLRFLHHRSRSRDMQSLFKSVSKGIMESRLRLYPETLLSLPIELPPLDYQGKVSEYLDKRTARIDTLIAKKTRFIELLKEKRQAVITKAVTKGLDDSVEMKDSGLKWLGRVPEHWSVMACKYACALIKDGTHLPPPRVEGGVPLLSVRNVQDRRFNFRSDDSTISESDYIELCRSFKPEANDILLAIVGATIGKTAVVPDNMGRFHIQRSLAVFRVNQIVNHLFLHYVFQSAGYQQLLWEGIGFSAQPGVYLGALSNFRIPVPPLDEQLRIVDYIGEKTRRADTLIAKTERSIELLNEHRAALITAAVTGKIDVREAA
jgi:type I restriction enzyme S subunit